MYGFDGGYGWGCNSYVSPYYGGRGRSTFVLIVVLFILLIIIGATCYK